VLDDGQLPASVDGVIAMDAAVSLRLAGRYPGTPQVFVAHSTFYDLQSPPQLPGLVATAVALNDRVATRLGSLGLRPPIVRLRQPVDVQWFRPGSPLPERPRRALLLSNRIGARRDAVRTALERRGMAVEEVGAGGSLTTDPRAALLRADVVIGYGRSVLEGMACGRAVIVYDHRGGDGWVTSESYPRLESEGFAGAAIPKVLDPRRFDELLAAYDPAMGAVNADLIVLHHKASHHAEALVGLFDGRLEPAEPPGALDEMARLVRLQYRAQEEALAANRRAAAQGTKCTHFQLEAERLQREAARFQREAVRLQERNEQLEQLANSPRVRIVTALPSLRRRNSSTSE